VPVAPDGRRAREPESQRARELTGDDLLHDHQGRLASLAAGARLRGLASARLLAGAITEHDDAQDPDEAFLLKR
jgi:hypothetical protein